MSAIRKEKVTAALNRSHALIDHKIHDNFHKHHEFRKQTILTDKSLTKDEKNDAIKMLNKTYDRNKVLFNEGEKRICENCSKECLATLYCELCVQNYLKEKFSNWTSGNDNIDNLIWECQMKTLEPEKVVEWIPYNNLQNIKYLTEGGCSKIYTASWINGEYKTWDSKVKQLKRSGRMNVVLKGLENVEGANERWFKEAKTHLIIGTRSPKVVKCYGLTQDPSNGNYMLVIMKMDTDLRNYLQNHNQLTWKERIQIVVDIINALNNIHNENAIHRDLHSGNILFKKVNWRISDLGFCGPASRSSKSIYGSLPYIAPEVIAGEGYTFKSDIYSIGILMWEISSGQPPFCNYKHDFDFVTNVINGMRPKVASETPIEYQSLMEQCWDADPLKRPDISTIKIKIREIHFLSQNIPNVESIQPKSSNNLGSVMSKVHQFESMPKPRNATKEEQEEEFYTKSYDFCIPNDIELVEEVNDLDKEPSNQNKDNNKNLSEVFNELQINSEDDTKNDNQETTQQIKESTSC